MANSQANAPVPRFLVRILPDGIWQILPEWVEPYMLIVADYELVEIGEGARWRTT